MIGRGCVAGTLTVLTLISCFVMAVVPAGWNREKKDIIVVVYVYAFVYVDTTARRQTAVVSDVVRYIPAANGNFLGDRGWSTA